MDPRIENVSEDNNDTLTFTLSGVNVSIANAIRRTILSNINTVIFRTAPYEENKANIMVNTSRLNNEILKQRLSCIPIHITDLEMPLQNYIMEVNVENLTDTIVFVTTKDFKVKNLTTNEYLSEKDTRKIFPPNELTAYFIDFVRLRPKISDEIPGEKIHLTCEFSIGNAKEDGMFNVASTSAYGLTPDAVRIEEILGKKMQQWRDESVDEQNIKLKKKDWFLLEGHRIFLPDSFDLTIQTVGVYSNEDILKKACDILIKKLSELITTIETNQLEIIPSENTMQNCFDIILKDEDYTIGKVIEYIMYDKYFHGEETLSFCGFSKMHPHDTDSIIRLAYKTGVDPSNISQNLLVTVSQAISIYQHIKQMF